MDSRGTTILKDELPGQGEIGPYRLMGLLGRGGMAEVFMAEHRHLAQVRAVKVLLPEVAMRAGVVDRLLTEARATARLRHPSIVEVFDCDTLPSGGAFIAMELLEGEPANQWLERTGPLADSPVLVAAILAVIADALGFAHQHGVVHRDVKPDNLFLIPDPAEPRAFSIKVLDFGVAKLLREEPVNKTREGAVIGTPLYMAPEQWQPGGLIDRRTDIYSLGCVFFELLSGQPPFAGGDSFNIMRAHLTDAPPDVRTLVPQVPEVLALVLGRMLAKVPDERPQSMEEVVASLSSYLGRGPTELGALLQAPLHAPVSNGRARASETQRGLGVTPATPVAPISVRPAAPPTAPTALRWSPTAPTELTTGSAPSARDRGLAPALARVRGDARTLVLIGAVAAAVVVITIALTRDPPAERPAVLEVAPGGPVRPTPPLVPERPALPLPAAAVVPAAAPAPARTAPPPARPPATPSRGTHPAAAKVHRRPASPSKSSVLRPARRVVPQRTAQPGNVYKPMVD